MDMTPVEVRTSDGDVGVSGSGAVVAILGGSGGGITCVPAISTTEPFRLPENDGRSPCPIFNNDAMKLATADDCM